MINRPGETAILMAGQMHPPFLFWSCQKRNGPCTVQREKTLWSQLCTCVQSCCTGVGGSVPAPISPDLRARYHLLRDRCCRPVADGAEGVGVQERIRAASLSTRSALLRAALVVVGNDLFILFCGIAGRFRINRSCAITGIRSLINLLL